MAVLKKIRSRLFSTGAGEGEGAGADGAVRAARAQSRYDVRPLTAAQLDECWRLDLRCFVDGEAYSRETFEYLLTSPDSVSYRAVTSDGSMVGFIVGIVEPDRTGHITTLGVAPEHRRRGVAQRMLLKVEEGFKRRGVRITPSKSAPSTPARKTSTASSATPSPSASHATTPTAATASS